MAATRGAVASSKTRISSSTGLSGHDVGSGSSTDDSTASANVRLGNPTGHLASCPRAWLFCLQW